MRLELDLPFRIESLNRGLRMGVARGIAKARRQQFAAQRKVKLQRNGAGLIVKTKLTGPTRARLMREGARLVITLTRVAPGTLDDDGLSGGFKAVRDGIADALGVNDRHPRLRWFYAQVRGGPRFYASRVLFETMTVDELVARLGANERARA